MKGGGVMTATRKSLCAAVCFLLVLGLVIVQATAAEPSGQKKKPPSSSTDIPAMFEFVTFAYPGPVMDIHPDLYGPYIHDEWGIVARMGSRSGAVTLETKDGPRVLRVDFYDQGEVGGCDFGDCERPWTVPNLGDPVAVPQDSLGMFLRIGNNMDLRDIAVGAQVSDPLHIRINTGDRDYITLKYFPASDHPKSLCPILSEEDGSTVYAQVTRLGEKVWQVEGTTARVEEYFGNKGHCRGYVNMPVTMIITLLQ
jgi:hypothetical protein